MITDRIIHHQSGVMEGLMDFEGMQSMIQKSINPTTSIQRQGFASAFALASLS
jgi:hypothetical protein